MLQKEHQKIIQDSVLCWLATVDDQGQPNVSPKEMFTVLDEHHLGIAHIASPRSVRNIQHQSKVCVSILDVFVQKGFKFYGEARILERQHLNFPSRAATLLALAEPMFKIQSLIEVKVTQIKSIVAPSYFLYPDTTTEASQIASALRTYRIEDYQQKASQD